MHQPSPDTNTSATRKRVLLACDVFRPGFKAGGPIVSIERLVERLGDELDLHVVTADRDQGDGQPYPDLPRGVWVPRGKARIFYVPRRFRLWHLLQLLRRESFDAVHLNSLFSRAFSMWPLFLCALGRIQPRSTRLVLSPRGELAGGALDLKGGRKALYLKLFRMLGFPQRLRFHATKESEKSDLHEHFGLDLDVVVAQNLPPEIPPALPPPRPDPHGVLRVVFVSRISPMKNLATAIELLNRCSSPVKLDVYGACVEPDYLRRCEEQAGRSPDHVQVTFHGLVQPEEVLGIFARHDVFFLPTLGENFGHVILESLIAGTPVLLSDTTPWNHLESRGAGWVVPLDRPDSFVEILDAFAAASPDERARMRRNARTLAEEFCNDPELLARYPSLYR